MELIGADTPPLITAYIAVGSNLGDRKRFIHDAVAMLRNSSGIAAVRMSSLIENPAIGGRMGSPAFLNGAIELRCGHDAKSLLARLLAIEFSLGRTRYEKWGPRTIDLDLLLFGDAELAEPGLIVPHPRMHQRRFVLEPLAEIAPHAVHPTLGKTVGELLAALEG